MGGGEVIETEGKEKLDLPHFLTALVRGRDSYGTMARSPKNSVTCLRAAFGSFGEKLFWMFKAVFRQW